MCADDDTDGSTMEEGVCRYVEGDRDRVGGVEALRVVQPYGCQRDRARDAPGPRWASECDRACIDLRFGVGDQREREN